MSKTITLTVQQLGQQLAVCIPADIVKDMRLAPGQRVMLQIPTTPDEIGKAEALLPSLEQMLAQYDPEKFGGEVLASPPIGREIIK